MARPDFIPEADWKATVVICTRWKVDPYFIAAIGWHETHWNTHPRSPKDYHLGYGWFPGSTVKEKYKGLLMQVEGACKQIARDMQKPITLVNVTNFAVESWRSGAPRSWAQSVYSIWSNLAKDILPQPTDTEVQDLSKRVETVEYAVNLFKELISKLAKEFGREQ
ncbi:hypothetical protein ES708_21511 [subsurface metagenome]